MDEKVTYKGINIPENEREFSKNFGEKEGSFSIKMPLPYEKAHIISKTSRALGGVALDSLEEKDREYVRMIITLNHVITKFPPWWQGADKCPDDDFLAKLWEFFLDCEQRFQEYLKKNS